MAVNLTVIQLERILERKRTRLDALVSQRERLQKKLGQVESRIHAIGGVTRERRRGRGRKRPKNAMPLIQLVTELLSQNKKGLTLKVLAGKVLEAGYKTASGNFENTLYQCLYNNQSKLSHDAKTHTYRLK